MTKDQNLPNKNIHGNKNSGKPLSDKYNTSRQQSLYRNNYRGRSPDRRISRNFLQKRYSRSNNQYRNSFSRSNSNRSNYSNYNRIRSNANSRNRYFSNDRSRNSSYNRNKLLKQ